MPKAISTLMVLGVLTVTANAPAVRAEDTFYSGKTITLVVSAGAGGGYTAYARLLSRYIGRHIPGEPSVTLQYRQGAGGVVAANYLYNVAPRDGSVIAAIHRGAVSSLPLFGGEGVKYRPSDFTWIGRLESETSFCVSWHTSPVKTFADMLTRDFIVGGVGDGSETDVYPFVMNNVFGARVKLVTGYKSGTDIGLAMERGEIEGRCAWSLNAIKTSQPDWLRDKKLNFLMQFALEKNPEMPDVALVLDMARTADERKVLELIVTPQVIGRVYLAPPALPADRTKILRAAFDRTVVDSMFLAEAEKQHLNLSPASGEVIEQLINKMFSSPPELVRAASEAMERKNR